MLEIVSEPDMRSGQDAAAYGAELRRIMVFLGVSDGEMSVGTNLLTIYPILSTQTLRKQSSHLHIVMSRGF